MTLQKAQFTIENFLSEVKTKGLAKTNRFEVNIPIPKGFPANSTFRTGIGSKINLYCEETNFPPLNVGTRAYRIFGPSYQMPFSVEYGGEGISMTFHVNTDMSIKRFFEEWISLVVNKTTFTLSYREEYLANIIELKQLDEQNQITYTCKIYEAFPRSMNIMPLNQSNQNQTHRLTVMFAYRYWEGS